MEHLPDPRERVIAELARRRGELRRIADQSGVAYDTVLRIKNREGDPGYSKVMALASYLFPEEVAPAVAAVQEVADAA